ncbi:MAG: hypothetical protein QM212_09015 [Bacteroidota bacterium]|jgi:predicted membrane protein|nr:OadG family protein [Bacteroidales bacterium]MDI9536105.1 hypothetical protein [Bacteroidota bacterium]OQC45244.1 MAG: hypothetical protein BWX59_01373 [Bacteroidetes bacterium ADurb.Bin028]NLP19989.1 OadG family protein [Bacteroidales bacterium]HOD89405.1 hypothetical protein [Bacteroidales bacterium]
MFTTKLFLAIQWGDVFALIGICFTIVLCIMALFVLILQLFAKVSKKKTVGQPKDNEKQIIEKNEVKSSKDTKDGEIAAFALAISLYLNEVHDNESLVLTIKNKENSNWNNLNYYLQ